MKPPLGGILSVNLNLSGPGNGDDLPIPYGRMFRELHFVGAGCGLSGHRKACGGSCGSLRVLLRFSCAGAHHQVGAPCTGTGTCGVGIISVLFRQQSFVSVGLQVKQCEIHAESHSMLLTTSQYNPPGSRLVAPCWNCASCSVWMY